MKSILKIGLDLCKEKHFKWTLILFVSSFVIVFFQNTSKISALPSDKQGSDEIELDTFIPARFVLVPIQIQNIESVHSLMGPYARVDLYSDGKSTALAKDVRLLRSPRDPSQVAVLVSEKIAHSVVAAAQAPLIVTFQNRNNNSASEILKNKTSTRIQWEDQL